MQRYVPDTLVQLWQSGAPTQPQSVRVPSAILFADITGFTPLVGRLSGKGRAEIEVLRRALDVYFGQAVERVHEYGGDVFAFAGDALLALWTGDDPAVMAQRATACAMAVREQLSGWVAAEGVVLELRIVVSAGETALLTVGGHAGRWETIAVGETLDAVAASLALASAGEIVLCATTVALLGGAAKSSALGGSRWRLESMGPIPLHPLVPSQISPEILAGIEARLPAALRHWRGNERYLGERRRVTVMFVLLPAIEQENPEWLIALHHTVREVQALIVEGEGTLTEVTADDKGLVVVAAWGLPPLSHEDDPVEAIECAMTIAQENQRAGRVVSIGVTTGVAYCGVVGNAARAAYTMLGAPVNLAARLMQAAKGRILVDATSRDEAVDRVEFEAVDPLRVKGSAQPVAAFVPVGRQVVAAPTASVVIEGRDVELSRLDARLDEWLAQGKGGYFRIEGEAGIGKTAIVDHLRLNARSRGAIVVATDARASLRTTPFQVVSSFLMSLLALEPGAPADRISEVVFAAVPQDADSGEAALILEILGVEHAGGFQPTRLSPEAQRDARLAAAAGLVGRKAALGPLMLIADDAQWIDSASRDWLSAVLRFAPTVLVVTAGRPSATPAEKADKPDLVLHPLNESALRAIAERHAGCDRLPDAVRALLNERAAGNPFFAQELVSTLLAEGILEVRDRRGVLVGETIQPNTLPTTIAGLVTARLDRLPALEQRALKVGSVLGHRFRVATLLAIAPGQFNESELSAALAQNALIQPVLPDGTWEFRQLLVREAIYDGMLLEQRRELHAAVFKTTVENLSLAELAPHYPVVALHASAAEDWHAALLYMDLAGEQALQRWANAEALRFSRAALDIAATRDVASSAAQRGRWNARVAEANFRLGNMEATLAAGQRALEFWNVPLPSTPAGQGIGLVKEWFARFSGARVPSLEPTDLTVLLDLHGRLVDVEGFRQSAGGFLLNLFRELALAERLGLPARASRVWLMFYFFFAATPLERWARPWTHRARSLLEQETDLSRQAPVAFRLGVASIYVAEWEPAQRDLERGIELAETQGELRSLGEALLAMCHLHSIRGECRAVAATVARVRNVTTVTGDRQLAGLALALLADANARSGFSEAAERILGEAVEHLDALDPGPNRVLGQGIRAFVARAAGNTEAALVLAQEAISTHEGLISPMFWTYAGLIGAAEVLFSAAGVGPTEKAWAKRAVRQLERNAKTYPFARALKPWAQSQWAWANNQSDRGAVHLFEAFKAANRDGLLLLAATCRAQLVPQHNAPLPELAPGTSLNELKLETPSEGRA